MSPEDFKAKALPLHAHITQIPPKLDESKDDLAAPSTSDAGFLASIAMQPSTFSTKSYGWKGSRRLTIPYVPLVACIFNYFKIYFFVGCLEEPTEKQLPS